ncbi:SagB/ThcOx family dehydrogenase [Candidatus Latescibacterota bacterium]
MKTQSFRIISLIAIILLIGIIATSAQELKPINLPAPQKNGGRPLMQVLNDRRSSREFSSEKFPLQILSNLLWAAWGINREDSGKHTAPSASNMQEIDVYAVMAEGLYLYDAKTHTLQPVTAEDIRAQTGRQDFVKDAPVNLIFVADYARMGNRTPENMAYVSAVDTGFISQNVYLFCASEGLATVVRGMVDKPALKKAMKLRPDQNITFAQSVGYPKR